MRCKSPYSEPLAAVTAEWTAVLRDLTDLLAVQEVRNEPAPASSLLNGEKQDDYATQKPPAIRKWFARRPRWHIHFTPTGASSLNQVERFVARLTEKQPRRGVHRSTQELEDAIPGQIEAVTSDPGPFRWTKSADDTLATVKRFFPRTLEVGERQSKSSEFRNQDTRNLSDWPEMAGALEQMAHRSGCASSS